ncbi:MAG: PA14 domain-containing protein, partial [Chloroflexota bacterium]
LQMLEGNEASPFATGWYEEPNGFLYYMAAIFKVFGANWISLKLVSLIPSILTIAAIYLLGRLLFGPTAGLFAMLLLAVSRWHMSMSRWGWAITPPPFFQIMAFFFLIRGLRDRRALDYALGGILLSLSVYTYLSSRLAAATLILYVGYWFISDPSGLRVSLRRSLLGVIIFGCAALVTVAPLLVTYISDPFILNNRVDEISIFRDMRDQGTIAPLVANITDILKFFHQTGDHQGKHNLPDEPMTDPTTGLLFGIGLAYTVFALRDQRRLLLVMWLVIGLAGSFLSSNHESPQSFRSLTALPAVILMAADMLDRMIRAVYRFLREQRFAFALPYLPPLAAGGLAIGVLATSALWETGVYFGPQASSISVIQGFNPIENAVAHATIDGLEADKTIYLSPNFSDFSPMRFLVYGVVKAETGENTLINRPYRVVLPEVNFPLPDDGHDAIVMLDRDYWLLRDYIASFYPEADMELMTLSDGEPTFMRIDVPQAQIAALQGLTERITYADGRQEARGVDQVELDPANAEISEVKWEGAIRLEHGGDYDLRGEGGLQVFIDGQPLEGQHYLGRGLYGLRVVWQPGASRDVARLIWQIPDQQDTVPVPREALFRVTWPQQGLLGTYYRNTHWEGTPAFSQVTPFLLLAWPDEQPIVPNGEFSARFTGALRITEAGTYSFHVEADDGVRLTLDGNVLGEALTPNQPNGFDVTTELSAGDHPIQIDYFQQGGGSALRLYWRQGEQNWTPVPPAALVPDLP